MVADVADPREGMAVGPGRVAVALASDLDRVVAGDPLPEAHGRGILKVSPAAAEQGRGSAAEQVDSELKKVRATACGG